MEEEKLVDNVDKTECPNKNTKPDTELSSLPTTLNLAHQSAHQPKTSSPTSPWGRTYRSEGSASSSRDPNLHTRPRERDGVEQDNMAAAVDGAPAVHADGMEFTGSSYRGDSTSGRCVFPSRRCIAVPMQKPQRACVGICVNQRGSAISPPS